VSPTEHGNQEETAGAFRQMDPELSPRALGFPGTPPTRALAGWHEQPVPFPRGAGRG
jgi:hypothetical protein